MAIYTMLVVAVTLMLAWVSLRPLPELAMAGSEERLK